MGFFESNLNQFDFNRDIVNKMPIKIKQELLDKRWEYNLNYLRER